ncbi:MAG: hypothetical protein DI582_10300 [Azospirillum brasilense]|nr:MAG: hypothetical protein DI582_10300 [Azospirillum brasilense]
MFLPSNITLKFGDSGDFVSELQRRLAMVNCFSEDQVNGFYDGTTVNAVTHFQAMNGLHADGVAGPETLRRLNGVIAGDSGGSKPTAQEEEQKLAYQTQQISEMATDQALLDQQNAAALYGAPTPEAAPAPAPAMPPAPAVETYVAPVAAALSIPVTVAPNIAQMQEHLLGNAPQQGAPAPIPTFTAQAPAPAAAAAAPSAAAQDLMQMLASVPTQAAQPQPAQQPAAATEAAKQPIATEQTAAPAQGLVEKSIRFTSGMMQKIAEYIEAKLPANVLREVQQAGQVMANAGMKEAPIPTGPEMVRAQEQLPARGPEQQPQQTR